LQSRRGQPMMRRQQGKHYQCRRLHCQKKILGRPKKSGYRDHQPMRSQCHQMMTRLMDQTEFARRHREDD
jgi:hypothetical protein